MLLAQSFELKSFHIFFGAFSFGKNERKTVLLFFGEKKGEKPTD
jgi:hypothetical protein